MAERDRIARHFAPLAQAEAGSFSLTDDAALLTPPPGHGIVVTTDSVIESIHVLPGAHAAQIAQKLVRRNLSDLAAMGATPWRYFLNMHTPPDTPDAWFAEFAATLAQEQASFHLTLAGGDSTSAAGPVHATLTCLGVVRGPAMLRSKAQPGDDVYVTGTVGDAALGLKLLQQLLQADSAATAHLTKRYHTPEPRVALGAALRDVAHAAIDLSDGLLADANQLAAASGVQLQLVKDALPLSAAAQAVLAAQPGQWDTVLKGGDDYELLFTAPSSEREEIDALREDFETPITRIGTVQEGKGVLLDGVAAEGGFEHR